MVDQSQLDQDLRYLEIGQKEGARLAWGGEQLDRSQRGFYLSPALFTESSNATTDTSEGTRNPAC